MENARELYNELFIGITYLLPYDSFDPASPPSTIDTLSRALAELEDERDSYQTALERIRDLEIVDGADLNYAQNIASAALGGDA